MTFREFLDRFDRTERTITIYAPTSHPDIVDQFETRVVSVTHTPLPSVARDEGFLVIRDTSGFVASIGMREVREFLEPPIYRPWDEAFANAEYRVLLEILDDTVWYSLDRRQLLATSREIEDRAWRVGEGTLRVGFQRLSLLQHQLPIYERLAEETNLEIHVYGRTDDSPPNPNGLTIHAVDVGDADDSDGSDTASGEIGEFWFLTFDGGDDEQQACALLAEERDPDEFAGFWSYDPAVVDEIASHVASTYG
ncbi:sensor protein [Natronococcus pandeyae]|uniref:Sensor protein n=1 Tax=Natronococcus pandeyae TaxID=2055836 RepID=A0A8J8Q4W9_9EURY|nr:DICT sensory domain-containing protein [Natronococcus pandeyae]TYL40616.1 sensor protein [Natronococcus pandeyae]